jgi:ParB family transcriptional regulator, chromosome partitioning protein
MADESRSRLGRGLAALMGDVDAETKPTERSRHHRRVPIEYLKPNPRNPRRSFSDADLEELAASIKQRGVIQPVLVRPIADSNDAYEIVAGERRWRAAQRAGLHEIPIVPVEATDAEALELAIIENVQRTDLNPVEEAGGYQQLIEEFGYTQEKLSTAVGKSRSHIANLLRLLRLSPRIQKLLSEGKISAGHARMLVTASDPEAFADQIVALGLNVREVEKKAKAARSPKTPTRKDTDTKALERLLADRLGLSVSIAHGQRGGTITIRYRSLDQLDDVIRRLQKDPV